MADIVWGTNSTGAWDTGASWVGGVKPGVGDNAVFTGEFTGAVTAPAAPETILNIEVAPTYPGQMGTSGSPLTINGVHFDLRGSAAAYWTSTATGHITIKSATRAGDGIVGDFTQAAAALALNIAAGKVTIGGSSSLQNINIAGGQNTSSPLVTIESGAAIAGTVDIQSGTVTSDTGASADWLINGGRLTLDALTNMPAKLHCSGGVVAVTGTAAITLNEVWVGGGGVVDFSGHKGSFTSTSADTFVILPGAFLNLDSGKRTAFAGTAILWAGGRLKMYANDFAPVVV